MADLPHGGWRYRVIVEYEGTPVRYRRAAEGTAAMTIFYGARDDESCGQSLGAATDERLIALSLALGNVSVAPQDESDMTVRQIGAMTPQEARECLARLAVGGTLSTFPRRRRRHWPQIAAAVLSVAGVAVAVAAIIIGLVY